MADHLALATEYIAKGEQFYRKAAEEIEAAREEGFTWAAIAVAVGRSDSWCQRLLSWHKSYSGSEGAPFGGPDEMKRLNESKTRTVLRDSSAAEIAHIIESLPPAQIKKIAEASTERLPAFAGRDSAPLDISRLPKTGAAKLNRWIQEGKDLWERYEADLTETQTRHFIDQLAAFTASIASREEVA